MIDERYARNLLALDGATVAATVDNFLRREDIVLKKAKFEMPPSLDNGQERLDFSVLPFDRTRRKQRRL